MSQTVAFTKNAANVFFHLLTQCNLHCRHCYINPAQHGSGRLDPATAVAWMAELAQRHPAANLILLGGEPTLHPGLASIVSKARKLGFKSVTIDTNGYLFHDILEQVTPVEVDYFSFSLDGATAERNDAIRGAGSFEACTRGALDAKAKGFRTSLIFTVSALNIDDLPQMQPLLTRLGIDRFFIQVIGLRGQAQDQLNLQLTRDQWLTRIPPIARQIARMGIHVTYPKVFLAEDEPFQCAGRVADNYFIFPNGRVYACPLCEDFPLHAHCFVDNRLVRRPPITEQELFQLDIAEGCVMNRLIQPHNIKYSPEGRPLYRIACCLLKEEVSPAT